MSTPNSERIKTIATILKVVGSILLGVGILVKFAEREEAG